MWCFQKSTAWKIFETPIPFAKLYKEEKGYANFYGRMLEKVFMNR